jgi:hypothetical protein
MPADAALALSQAMDADTLHEGSAIGAMGGKMSNRAGFIHALVIMHISQR